MTTGMFNAPRSGGIAKPAHEARKVGALTSRFRDNASQQIGNPALYLRVQVKAVPAASEYQAWIDSVRGRDNRGTKLTGEQLRRAVRMIRSGSSIRDCEKAVFHSIRPWLLKLPPELAA